MADSISRRTFLRQAAAAPAAGIAGAPVAEQSGGAWILIGINWQYNDEFTYEEGEQALARLYCDRQDAEAECRRLCDGFFAAQTPQEFEVNFELYRDDLPEDVTEETVTWEQLLHAGFPQPYYVQEMAV